MRKPRIFVSFLILVLGLSVAGCGVLAPATVEADTATQAVVSDQTLDLAPNLSVSEVAETISQTSVLIVDVREDYEYDAGHIPGAVLIPLGELADRVDEIPTDLPVILVCRSGNRSGQAYDFLENQGFSNVHNMLGGMNDWTASGYDVEY
jgi:rhodanese-related sulfurtransferase